MKVVVIGATGHVGTYLVPRLVEAGHVTVSVSRCQRQPYLDHSAWSKVQKIVLDRNGKDSEKFGRAIADLKPEVVVDMLCYRPEQAEQMVDCLKGRVSQYLCCGTIWVYGRSTTVPTTEDRLRVPLGDYGIQKASLETFLLKQVKENHFPAALFHPGHIVGQGWTPLNPVGHFNPQVFVKISRGEELVLPNLGMETVHHIHADDIASAIVQMMGNWDRCVGESFNIVSPQALTLRGFSEGMFEWFGQKPNLKFLPFEEWQKTVSSEEAQDTLEHISHSPCCSIEKASRRFNYKPKYSSMQAVGESVEWLIQNKVIKVGR